MSETEWFCGVQLGGVKLPAEFPAARNSKSMVHAGTGIMPFSFTVLIITFAPYTPCISQLHFIVLGI